MNINKTIMIQLKNGKFISIEGIEIYTTLCNKIYNKIKVSHAVTHVNLNQRTENSFPYNPINITQDYMEEHLDIILKLFDTNYENLTVICDDVSNLVVMIKNKQIYHTRSIIPNIIINNKTIDLIHNFSVYAIPDIIRTQLYNGDQLYKYILYPTMNIDSLINNEVCYI